MQQASIAPSLGSALRETFVDGLRMTAAILPSILAVGLLGLLAAKYTPLFDALGVLFYPLTWLFGLEEPMQVARAISAGLAGRPGSNTQFQGLKVPPPRPDRSAKVHGLRRVLTGCMMRR